MVRMTKVTLLALAIAAWATGAAAQEIYRWVDAEGVVHFSDTPPPAESAEVQTLDVPAAPPAGYDPAADIFNIEATRQRTQARRERLQEQADERARSSRSPSPPVVQSGGQAVNYGYPYVYPVYPRPPRPNPPPRPPRPEPPADDTSTLRPPGRADGADS